MTLREITSKINSKINKILKQPWGVITDSWRNLPRSDYHLAMEILGR